jgi:group I intron endonuclease
MSEPTPDIPDVEKAHIYKITNKINGKIYIGETKEKNPIKRWYGHLHAIRRGKGCPLLRAAFQKHGEENFTFEVIQECSKDERFIIEEQKIKEYNSMVPNGYNATIGGMGGGFKGKKHSEETKKKMAKTISDMYAALTDERKEELRQIKRKPRTFSEEYKQKMRNYNLGKKLSEETRAKISNSLKHSALKEETRKKISESVKRTYENGRDASFTEERKANLSKVMTDVRGVKVEQYTKEGVFVKSYPSIKTAYCELNIKTGIDKVLSGKRKTAGGFIWKRVEE